MKTNTKIVDLLYEGFSPELIKSLNEKQVEVLHNKLMEGKKKSETKEQVTSVPQPNKQVVGQKGGKVELPPGQNKFTLTHCLKIKYIFIDFSVLNIF